MQEGIFSSEKLPANSVEFCVISDLHIANDEGNSSHAFSSQGRNDYVFANNRTKTPVSGEAYTLKRFCEKVNWSGRLGHFDDNQHMLILLGDIINGECGYCASYHSNAYQMLSASFLPWVHTGNIIYVYGNHDREAQFYSTLTNFPRKFIVEEFESRGVRFVHGHQFDFLCDGKSPLGMMGEFASNLVVRLFPPNVEDVMRGRDFYYDHSSENHRRSLRSLPSQATLQTMSGENYRVAVNALNWLRRRQAEAGSRSLPVHTIVCGHTHQSPVQISTVGGGLNYINVGKFAKDGFVNVVSRLKYPETNTWELL